jgi:hypothetical protein
MIDGKMVTETDIVDEDFEEALHFALAQHDMTDFDSKTLGRYPSSNAPVDMPRFQQKPGLETANSINFMNTINSINFTNSTNFQNLTRLAGLSNNTSANHGVPGGFIHAAYDPGGGAISGLPAHLFEEGEESGRISQNSSFNSSFNYSSLKNDDDSLIPSTIPLQNSDSLQHQYFYHHQNGKNLSVFQEQEIRNQYIQNMIGQNMGQNMGQNLGQNMGQNIG